MANKEYIEAAIETLDLIYSIANHLHSTKSTQNMKGFLLQIQTKAESKIISSPETPSGIAIPGDLEVKVPEYWEGVRDMVKLSKKKWVELKDIMKYLAFLLATRPYLAAKIGLQSFDNPLEDPPTPFVYYFPYPKPPPAASAEAHLKPTRKRLSDDLSLDEPSPLAQEFLDSTFFKDFLRKKDQRREA
ncbi:MAG: hypothetical protein ACW98I_20845 [Candidatus Hodarchaeales archaeon]|jgi:hypothetical protein